MVCSEFVVNEMRLKSIDFNCLHLKMNWEY
jgi:hypothetical protein